MIAYRPARSIRAASAYGSSPSRHSESSTPAIPGATSAEGRSSAGTTSDGNSSVRDDQEGEPFERRRLVSGEVHEVRAGGDEEPLQVRFRRGGDDALATRGEALGAETGRFRHSFILIGCGITANVAGVSPSTSPSASIGNGRSASTTSSPFTRNSSMCGCGTCSPR